MSKQWFPLIVMVSVWVGAGDARVYGEHGVALTPEAEFTTLSDMVSPAPAPVAGVVVSEPMAVVSTGSEAAVVSIEPKLATNTAPVALATGIVVAVKEPSVTTVSNVTVSTDSTPEIVPVTQFPGASGKQNLISVALDDVPLQDVIRLFTKISGANIIAASTNLQGKVTVNLQDVEWKPALDSILDMYSMMVVEKVPGSGIYSIMPKAPGMADPLIAQPIFLNYAQVSNVVAVIKPMAGPEGMVSPFPNANAIVVRATAANLNAIRKVVQEIDLPRQQVYIEAKFLELTDEAIKDLGIDWQSLQGYAVSVKTISQTLTDERSKFNGQRTGLGTVDSNLRAKGAGGSGSPGSGATDIRTSSDTIKSGSSSSLSDSTKDGLASASGLTASHDTSASLSQSANYSHESEHIAGQHLSDVRTAVLSPDDFKLVLSALQQINGISIVSNPKIIVANEETATIHIGNNEPNIKGTVTPGQQGQANSITYALDDRKPYFEFGISLEVTPTINNLSNVTVRIAPTLSRFVSNKVAPDNNTYPVESTKTIKTTFSLENGKTAAIGGLTETNERDEVTKIPFLGDLPLLGKYLFSHTHKQRTQTETIIFVTVGLANPRTIVRSEGLPEDTTLVQKHFAQQATEKAAADAAGKPAAKSTKVDAAPAKTP